MKLVRDFVVFYNDWRMVGILLLVILLVTIALNKLPPPTPPLWLTAFSLSLAVVVLFFYGRYRRSIGIKRRPPIPIIKGKKVKLL